MRALFLILTLLLLVACSAEVPENTQVTDEKTETKETVPDEKDFPKKIVTTPEPETKPDTVPETVPEEDLNEITGDITELDNLEEDLDFSEFEELSMELEDFDW